MARISADHVRIVMATYNGARFLGAQLQSLVDQDHDNWSLVVGDDGSGDATRDILDAFKAAHPQRDITIHDGPGQGSAANFLTQARRAAPVGAWLAFCDQDDVWMPHKLSRALARMSERVGAGDIATYAGRTCLTDAALTPRGLSRQHSRPYAFANALVQNIVAGNTILLTPAAALMLGQTVPAALRAGVPFHDWWVYLLVTGAGGQVVGDDDPVLYYRQHPSNSLGHSGGGRGRMSRLGMVFDRTYAGWLDRNLAALQDCDALTEAARAHVRAFADLRSDPRALARLRALSQSGLYRQTRAGTLILRGLALSGRL